MIANIAINTFCEETMLAKTRVFLTNQSGATAIEYGLLCAGIGLLILAALNTTGAALLAKLTLLSDALL